VSRATDQPARTRLAAHRLRKHVLRCHARGGALVGPDSGRGINLRAGRFVKAALPFAPWRDAGIALQGIGYWARLNALLAADDTSGETAEAIRSSAEYLLARQGGDGSWRDEVKGEPVATYEGDWAAIALLQAFYTTGCSKYGDAACQWVSYLVGRQAFQPIGDGLFVTYWADSTLAIPNNSAEMLWVLSEVAKLRPAAVLDELRIGLVRFLGSVQMSSGELPYRAPNVAAPARPHYLCYQYNAFEFLAIARYAENTRDPAVEPILVRLANFLLGGVTRNGACRSSCQSEYPEVAYYAAALSLALRRAEAFVGAAARVASDRLTERLLALQRPDGSYGYSRGDYHLPFLRDSRSYPRPQAIIGYALAGLSGLDAGSLQFGGHGVAL
jgi:hypothetical protein